MTLSRVRPLVGVLLLAVFSAIAGAQVPTIEDIAGAVPATDRPATQVPMAPSKLAVAPDGRVYMADFGRSAVTRFDPANGTLTTLPQLPGQPGTLGFDSQGYLYVSHNAILYKYDLTTNQYTLPGYNNLGQVIADVAFDAAGNVYVLDPQSGRVRVIRPSGLVESFAGSGTTGFSGDGGPALLASFDWPSAIAADSAGNVYISDTNNGRIRRVSATTGIITTIAGTGNAAYNGEGLPALQTNITAPGALYLRADGSLLFTDRGSYRVRLLSGGVVATVAGNGVYAFTGDGGPATAAALKSADGIALDGAGNLYLGDIGNRRLRLVTASTGFISTVAGNGTYDLCGDGGPASLACLDAPRSPVFDAAGNLLFADMYNGRVRRIAGGDGVISTVAGIDQDTPYPGNGGLGPNTSLGGQLWAIGQDPTGNIYAVVNYSPRRIYRIDAQTNVVTVFAGTGAFGFSGDGGPATAATFQTPVGIVFDAAGNAYISDNQTNRIRKVAAGTGIITTFAGNGNTSAPLGDGGPAISANLWVPSVMAFDAPGNLVVADELHCRIRKIEMATGLISTIAGNGNCSATGNAIPAVSAAIGRPISLTYSPAGELYFATYTTIRKINAAGIVTTVVGDGLPLNNPSNRPVQYPYGMTFDAVGRLYITGTSPDSIRRIGGLPAPAPPTDTTPPIIVPGWTGTPGKLGWYRSNIQLQWSVIDNESLVTSSSGCTPSSVTQDTAGVTFKCTATSAGGTISQSITFKRDTVAPTLAFGAPSPAPDANGWNSGDVTIPFTTSDALSGVDTTSSGNPLTITGQGSGLGTQVVVTDLAGNSATFTTPSVKIDRTPPDVISSVTGTAGNEGWYRSDVQVSWTVTEPESVVSSTGCTDSSVTADTAGTTFTCTATSAGGTTTRSVTVKRDATAPTLTFGTPSPAADANGWRAAPVSLPFEASDATSGVASISKPTPLVITDAGDGITRQVVVADVAGNSATFTTEAFKIDASPPTITQLTYGSTGTNGWYRTDARVTFSVSEPESAIIARDGCDDSLVSTDTAGITITCTVTSAGGTTTKSVTVKRDATPPVLSWGAPSPAPNAAGWNTTDVAFAFTADDATSGVFITSQPSPAIVPFDGPGVTTQITVTDNAGNQATIQTPPVNIDRVEPVVNYFVSGTPGNNGWYTSDVQVEWQVVKAPQNILAKTGCVNSTVTADTAGTTFSCSVTSGAGTTSRAVTIKRDATPPVLTYGTPTPAPNTNGWNKTNVSIPFTRSDALSGIASTSVASPLLLSSEGASVTGQVTATDKAGNSATFTSTTRNIDKTAPVVTLASPANGATYGFYQDVLADFSCTDTSLLSCVGTTADGDAVNTKTAGARTFKVTGKDLVNFTTAVTNSFTVDSQFNFDGFLAPVNSPSTLNLVTRGSLVPIRWKLPDGHGGFVSNPASFVSATVATLTCGSAPVAPLNDTASGPAGINFDASSGTFAYNWATSAGWTGCRKLTIKLKDSSVHELRFKFQ